MNERGCCGQGELKVIVCRVVKKRDKDQWEDGSNEHDPTDESQLLLSKYDPGKKSDDLLVQMKKVFDQALLLFSSMPS